MQITSRQSQSAHFSSGLEVSSYLSDNMFDLACMFIPYVQYSALQGPRRRKEKKVFQIKHYQLYFCT